MRNILSWVVLTKTATVISVSLSSDICMYHICPWLVAVVSVVLVAVSRLVVNLSYRGSYILVA